MLYAYALVNCTNSVQNTCTIEGKCSIFKQAIENIEKYENKSCAHRKNNTVCICRDKHQEHRSQQDCRLGALLKFEAMVQPKRFWRCCKSSVTAKRDPVLSACGVQRGEPDTWKTRVRLTFFCVWLKTHSGGQLPRVSAPKMLRSWLYNRSACSLLFRPTTTLVRRHSGSALRRSGIQSVVVGNSSKWVLVV